MLAVVAVYYGPGWDILRSLLKHFLNILTAYVTAGLNTIGLQLIGVSRVNLALQYMRVSMYDNLVTARNGDLWWDSVNLSSA